eukprot:5493192-Amphidinium_carterae.1
MFHEPPYGFCEPAGNHSIGSISPKQHMIEVVFVIKKLWWAREGRKWPVGWAGLQIEDFDTSLPETNPRYSNKIELPCTLSISVGLIDRAKEGCSVRAKRGWIHCPVRERKVQNHNVLSPSISQENW